LTFKKIFLAFQKKLKCIYYEDLFLGNLQDFIEKVKKLSVKITKEETLSRNMCPKAMHYPINRKAHIYYCLFLGNPKKKVDTLLVYLPCIYEPLLQGMLKRGSVNIRKLRFRE
jgi:hypothetical protein